MILFANSDDDKKPAQPGVKASGGAGAADASKPPHGDDDIRADQIVEPTELDALANDEDSQIAEDKAQANLKR